MDRLVLHENFQARLHQLGLSTFGEVIRFFEAPMGSDQSVMVTRREILVPDSTSWPVFYKTYNHSSPSWKFVGRRSKAECEYQNYFQFGNFGLPTATPVAWGERRTALGRLKKAFIITEEIPDTVTLFEFFKEKIRTLPLVSRPGIRKSLLKQIASGVSKLHSENFFHHDLVGRNLLISLNPTSGPRVWWIDCPRGNFVSWGLAAKSRRLKDLASLDKTGWKLCSQKERVRFVKDYLGIRKLDVTAKTLIHQVTQYRKNRWPEDWNEAKS